jgi:hypothetical protein
MAIIPKQRKIYYLDSMRIINTSTDPLEWISNE